MNCAGGDVALHSCLHFLENRAPVRVVAEPDDRQHHCLFEDAKGISHAYIVDYIVSLVKPRCRGVFPRVISCVETAL